ncbi:MAG TPA: VOC family protein [Thermohalobaculum sp.]|nr:VOC family protein [Thermohalobaculum sp.]
MAKLAHSNIRVLDEQRSTDFYVRAFSLEVRDRLVFEDFSLIFLASPESDFELELTVNHGRSEPYSHGTGYGHLALTVDDIEAAHQHCAGLDLAPTPIKELHSEGRVAVRFFFVTDPDGYQVEIVHRQGRYR